MKLVFIFAIVFLQVFFIDVFEVMEIVGTFLVDAFVEDEVFPVLLWTRACPQWGQRRV
nr:hypothetical protein [Enterocloster clostridioformis]